MNKKIFATLFIFALISAAYAQEVTEDEEVIVLTEENFDSVIAKYEYVLVKFYAPWCGHCKSMAPAYAKAASHYKNDPKTSNIRLAKIDCDVHKDLAKRFAVKGFPTLQFFTNGKPEEYKGGREQGEIIQWITKKTQPAASQVTSLTDLLEQTINNKVVVLFLGDSSSERYTTYLELAKQIDDIVFVYSVDAEVLANHKTAQQLVLLKQFDDKRNDYEGNWSVEDLLDFVNGNKIPLLSEFSQDIAQAVFGKDKPALFLFVGDDEKSQQAKVELERVAKQLKGQIIFSWAQVKEGFGKRLGDYIGVTEDQVPTVRIVQNTEDAPMKFVLEGNIDEESINAFVQQFKNGKLVSAKKSEEIPVDNNGPVKIVVGRNFEEIVLDTTKDVLIEFYAPWCGHCKTLAPVWEELAEKMKIHPNVVIAKMDLTANEYDGLGVKGFPTLRWFPANNKKMPGMECKAGREIVDLVKFVEENISNGQEEKADHDKGDL